jgi:hypothetical protein
MRIMEIITYIAAVIAVLVLWATEATANGAPQEAAGAAFAIGIAVIPYCITATMQRSRLLDRTSVECD